MIALTAFKNDILKTTIKLRSSVSTPWRGSMLDIESAQSSQVCHSEGRELNVIPFN
jgi:hypothetical protein